MFIHAEFPREMQLVSADPTVRGNRTMEVAVVQQLKTVAINLVEEGVGFVGCQKCIHPTVKEYLREQVRQVDVSLFTGPVFSKVLPSRVWLLWIVSLPSTLAQ